jgi:phage repressor protein C with HTH and peptisase S24 domain
MAPTFRPGQVVVIRRTSHVSVGDIVMFRHDGIEKIKRVARAETGRLYLLGDNPQASTDSRNFGWVGTENLIGRIVWPRKS